MICVEMSTWASAIKFKALCFFRISMKVHCVMGSLLGWSKRVLNHTPQRKTRKKHSSKFAGWYARVIHKFLFFVLWRSELQNLKQGSRMITKLIEGAIWGRDSWVAKAGKKFPSSIVDPSWLTHLTLCRISSGFKYITLNFSRLLKVQHMRTEKLWKLVQCVS